MDPLIQGVMGAACALLCFGRVLGWRAAPWGALGAFVPDVGGVAAGLVGALVAGPLLGYGVWRLHARWKRARLGSAPPRPRAVGTLPDPGDRAMLATWMALFVMALLAPALLDLFRP